MKWLGPQNTAGRGAPAMCASNRSAMFRAAFASRFHVHEHPLSPPFIYIKFRSKTAEIDPAAITASNCPGDRVNEFLKRGDDNEWRYLRPRRWNSSCQLTRRCGRGGERMAAAAAAARALGVKTVVQTGQAMRTRRRLLLLCRPQHATWTATTTTTAAATSGRPSLRGWTASWYHGMSFVARSLTGHVFRFPRCRAIVVCPCTGDRWRAPCTMTRHNRRRRHSKGFSCPTMQRYFFFFFLFAVSLYIYFSSRSAVCQEEPASALVHGGGMATVFRMGRRIAQGTV